MLKEQVFLHEKWIGDLNCLQNGNYTLIRTDMIKAMSGRYHQVIAEFDLQRELAENRLERTVHLHKNEVIPLVEKEEPEFLLKKTISEKNTFVAQSLIEWRQLSSDYTQTISHLGSEISGLQNDLESYVILAPCSGYLSKNHGIRKGSIVTSGQSLALVVPDEQLVSEHFVHSKDIGLMYIQMPVIFQVDAYPYQQWGLASGKIAEISKDVFIVEGTPYFKVKCTLDKQWLIHENGCSGNLKNGLTNTGRFITAHRTLSQWIFDKADRNLNPARID
jgi:HlyD family secretion protein